MTTSDATHDPSTVERTSVLAHDPTATRATDERLRRALDALLDVRGSTLAPLRRISPVPEGLTLTHDLPAGSVPLARLRAAGPWRTGHALTVALAVVDALSALADARLAHGDVTGEQVHVASDGRVVLAGAGLAWRRAPGEPGGPSETDDVTALGALVLDLLGPGRAPSPLALVAARAADAGQRQDLAALRASLQRCGRPDPLPELDGGTSRPVPPSVVTTRPRPSAPPVPRPRRRRVPAARGPRSIAVLLLVLLAVLGVGRLGARALGAVRVQPSGSTATGSTATGSTATGSTPSASTAVSSGPKGVPDTGSRPLASAPESDGPVTPAVWRSVVARIDAGRLRALQAGSVALLRDWVDPAGSAWAADAALAERVEASRARLEGGDLVLLDVRPVRSTTDEAVLLVQDRRTAYTVTGPTASSGSPARAPRWWRLTLAAAEAGAGTDGWRLRDVEPATEPDPAESGPAEAGRVESGRVESGRVESGPAEAGPAGS